MSHSRAQPDPAVGAWGALMQRKVPPQDPGCRWLESKVLKACPAKRGRLITAIKNIRREKMLQQILPINPEI